MNVKGDMVARVASCFFLVALILYGVLCEAYWAPLRPSGSFLVLKTLPLVFLLPGFFYATKRAYQWVSLLVWLYVLEAIMRGLVEVGIMKWLAWGELFLSLSLFASVCFAIRSARVVHR